MDMNKFLLMSALLMPFSGYASDWYFINDRNPSGISFFDKDSLSISNGVVTVWIQRIRLDDESNDPHTTKQKLKISCKQRTFQILQLANYNNKGMVSGSTSEPGKIRGVVPDSTGDFLLKIMCNRKFANESNSDDYFPVENPAEAVKMIRAEQSKQTK